MTTPVLASVVFDTQSALPKNRVVNNFAFNAADITSGTIDGIGASIESFYNTVNTGSGGSELRVATYLSREISIAANTAQIKWYNLTGHLNGTAHGPPFRTDIWTLADHSTTQLPGQDAICLSFHDDYSAIAEFGPGTRPRSRHRGRLFLGPLGQNTGVEKATLLTFVVSSNCRKDIAQAAFRFLDERADWGIWSRADATIHGPVVGGWIDERYDTQRRRLEPSTVRTLWT